MGAARQVGRVILKQFINIHQNAFNPEIKLHSDRSISDVFSRLKRAAAILPDKNIDRYFIVDLERTQIYQSLSTSVKSQIRKAISLKLAYLDSVIDK